MKTLLVLSISLILSQAQADGVLSNCQPDSIFQGQCECEIKWESGNTGRAFPQCSSLSCHEFSADHQPADCETPNRQVSCVLTRPYYPSACHMMFPRLPNTVDSKTLCTTAINDLEEAGPRSQYYKNLNFYFCRPSGYAYPPARGWTLIRVEDPLNDGSSL